MRVISQLVLLFVECEHQYKYELKNLRLCQNHIC